MTRAAHIVLSSLLLTLMAGCSAYVDNFQYEPHPALAEIAPALQPPPNAPPSLTTQPANPQPPMPLPRPEPVVSSYATVVGIYRGNNDDKIPPSVEIRLRLENHGPATAVLDPRTFELIDGELAKFPPAIVRPNEPMTIAPMRSLVLEVFFPFPPGRSWDNTDLQVLRGHWQVIYDGHPVEQSVEFHRAYYHSYYRRYYGPGWDDDPYYPFYPVYGGVVVVHRRW